MHIAEGVLPAAHAGGWLLVTAPFAVISAQRLRKEVIAKSGDRRALLSLGFAFVFAATIFPVPVPLVGVSSHMCFSTLLAILLGPWVTVLPVAAILLIQALFFAHGGLSTLGANTFTLGVLGPFFGYTVARLLFRVYPRWSSIALAAILSDLLVYGADAAILAFAFSGSDSAESFGQWFRIILAGFAPAQIPLACLEGAMTAMILRAVWARRRELLPKWLRPRIPMPATAVQASCALVFLWAIIQSPIAYAADYVGLDELVIEGAAIRAGRTPTPPWIDLESGDLGLFIFCLGGFVSGLLVGANWIRLFGALSAEPRRERPGHAP
jgi:cobalt/nickel transport system permease protein